MAENKKQHFVPKFYFKLFSNDGNNIEIYNPNQKRSFTGPFNTQCYENYFYGKNTELERSFSGIEGKQAEIIKKIIENKDLLCLTKEEYYFLLSFILFQHSRTKPEKLKAKKQTALFVENILKPFMYSSQELKESGITKENINELEIAYPSDYLLKLLNSLTGVYLIGDLTPILLINNTEKDFIFSDSPVIFYNTYFNNEEHYGTKGLQSSGLQIFCPLNRKMMVMLFDQDFYEVDNSNSIIINSEIDIDSLNILQFFYCYENIYFSDNKQIKYVKVLHSNLPNPIKKEEIKLDTYKSLNNLGSQYKEILHFHNTNINYNLKLSFIKIKNNISKKDKVRNLDMIEEYKIFMNDLFKNKSKTK